jgi:hypothetical protein
LVKMNTKRRRVYFSVISKNVAEGLEL